MYSVIFFKYVYNSKSYTFSFRMKLVCRLVLVFSGNVDLVCYSKLIVLYATFLFNL